MLDIIKQNFWKKDFQKKMICSSLSKIYTKQKIRSNLFYGWTLTDERIILVENNRAVSEERKSVETGIPISRN